MWGTLPLKGVKCTENYEAFDDYQDDIYNSFSNGDYKQCIEYIRNNPLKGTQKMYSNDTFCFENTDILLDLLDHGLRYEDIENEDTRKIVKYRKEIKITINKYLTNIFPPKLYKIINTYIQF